MLSLRELFPRYCCRLFDLVEQLNAASESASGSSHGPRGGGVGPGAPGPAGGSARRPATATLSPADSAADSLLPAGSIMTRIPSPSPHDDLPGPIQVERRHHEEPCSGPGEPQLQTESPSHLPQAATVSGIQATSSCESASQFASQSVGDADAPLGAPLARRDTVTESLPLDSASPPASRCAVTVADLNQLPDASTAASTVRAGMPVTSSPLAVGTTSGMMLQDEGAPVSGTGFHGASASGSSGEGVGTFVAPHRLGSNSNGEPALAALMLTPPPSPSPSAGPSSPSRKRPRSSSTTTSGSCLTCGSSMPIAFTEGGTLPEKVRALQASAGCSATPAQALGFGLDPGRDSLGFSELCQLDAAAPSGVSAQCNAPNLGSQCEIPSPSPGRRLRVHRIAALRRLLVEHALLFARTCSAIPMCRLGGKFIVIMSLPSTLHGIVEVARAITKQYQCSDLTALQRPEHL